MSAPSYGPGYYAPPPTRPIGVTILAVLTILVGIVILIAGFLILLVPVFLVTLGISLIFGLAVTVVAGIVVLFGLLWIGVGLGLLRLRSWAWWLAVIVMFLSFLSALATWTFALVPFLILVYLILVRKHFR